MGYYTTYVLNVDTLDLAAQEKESLERKIGPFGFDGGCPPRKPLALAMG